MAGRKSDFTLVDKYVTDENGQFTTKEKAFKNPRYSLD